MWQMSHSMKDGHGLGVGDTQVNSGLLSVGCPTEKVENIVNNLKK